VVGHDLHRSAKKRYSWKPSRFGQGLDHELAPISGWRKECGAGSAWSRNRSRATKARPERRLGRWEDHGGRQTAARRKVTKRGCPTRVPVGKAAFVLVHG